MLLVLVVIYSLIVTTHSLFLKGFQPVLNECFSMSPSTGLDKDLGLGLGFDLGTGPNIELDNNCFISSLYFFIYGSAEEVKLKHSK